MMMGAPEDPSSPAERSANEMPAARPEGGRDGLTVRFSGQLTLTAARLTTFVVLVLSLVGLHLQ